MGGDVSVKSELGKGTTFTVTIQNIDVEHSSDVKAEDLERPKPATALDIQEGWEEHDFGN